MEWSGICQHTGTLSTDGQKVEVQRPRVPAAQA